jgi:ankyrin repeat protein
MDFPDISNEHFFRDVKQWIEKGGSPNVKRSNSGWSLLHDAAELDEVEALEYLISHGCDPNCQDIFGQTPLHLAIDSDLDGFNQTGTPVTFRSARRLIDLGADLSIKDHRGKTPLDWVNDYGEFAKQKFKQLIKLPSTDMP